ncbi:MAG: hypothetical protein RL329_1165, partial [Bacteroidota bacterium]
MNQYITISYLFLCVCIIEGCQPVTSSISISQKGTCDTAMATFYYEKGKYAFNTDKNNQQALTYFKQSLEIRQACLPPTDFELFRTYYNVANAYFEIGNFTEAVTHFESAKNIIEKLNRPKFLALTLLKLNTTLGFLGENDRALPALAQAQQLFETLNDTAKIAETYNQIGICYYRKSNIQLAENQLLKAIQWFQYGEQNNHLGDCYNNLNALYQKINRFDKAENGLQKSLQYYQKAYTQTPNSNILFRMGNVYTEFGHLHLKQNNLNQAFIDYKKALTIFKQNQQAISITYQVEAQNGIAAIYEQQQQYQQALAWCDTSLTQLPDWTQAIATLELKARLLSKMNQIEPAYKTYCLLDSVLQKTYQLYKEDGSIYNLAEKSIPIYEKALKISLLRFEQTNNHPFLNQAFTFCNHSKAIVLRQALQHQQAKKFAGIPHSELETEQKWKQEIAFQQKQLNQIGNDSIQQTLFQAKEGLNQFIKQLETKYPNYHHLKYAVNQSFNLSMLQKSLPKDMLCLEFFMGDSTLFVFALTQQQVKVYPIATPLYLDSMIINLHESLVKPKSQLKNQYLTNAHALYQLLLEKPLKELNPDGKLTRLRIVPDGKLGYIPFDALLTQPANDWDDTRSKKVPYLLRSYSTSYNYFSDSIFNNVALKIKNNFCGFGIDYRDSLTNSSLRPKLGYLDHAPREVDAIQQFIGGKTWKNQTATKNCFLKNAAKSGILHLSMHSTTDDKNPLESQLIFSKKDLTDDNLLMGNELFAQQFTCGLAVLSACHTGDGHLQRGEGIMSLARAFAYSGCPSLVMSLW